VTIGGGAATGITVVNADSITATTPAGTAGAQDVVVTNPDTQFGTLVGGFTYVVTPTVPVLLSPANNATGVSRTAAYSWNASTDAISYRLQVATDSTFTTTVIDSSGVLLTSCTPATTLTYNTKYYWRVNASNIGGTSNWSNVWNCTTLPSVLNISLAAGWNMVSAYVAANNSVLDSLMTNVAANMVIMKNNGGQVYWPSFGVNSIGSWNCNEGYQVYMSSPSVLAIQGSMIIPETTPISLAQGWNMVSYLRYTSLAAETALTGIVNNLVIVKNNLGQVYWPAFSVNSIGSLMPGEGYQIYMSTASTLTYASNTGPVPKAIASRTLVPSCQYYSIPVQATGANAILLANSTELEDGDEVGVWTKNNTMAGAGVMNEGKVLITVWGDNDMTSDDVEGAKSGEELFLKWWSVKDNKENNMTIMSLTDGLTGHVLDGQLRYQSDALWVAQLEKTAVVPTSFQLAQNYPNPFNPTTTINYIIPEPGKVTVDIFNVTGQKVASLVNGQMSAGSHSVVWNAEKCSAGVYFYTVKAGNHTKTMKMTLLK
jgi:hypothetical protein